MADVHEENPAAASDGDTGINGQDVAVVADAGTLAWSGYLLVAAPFVAASWAGLVDDPVAAVFAYALVLLGVAFIVLAMGAPAKPKLI